jgi:hypothetical protein
VISAVSEDSADPPIDIEKLLASMAPPATPAEAFQLVPELREFIEPLDCKATLAMLSGLMTDPSYHANGVRLDWAARSVLAVARGRKKPKRRTLETLLNKLLADARVVRLEDPIEDFFVEAIPTVHGDFAIFSGHWEKAGIHTECILSAFAALPDGGPKQQALRCAYALLSLSHALIARAQVSRRVVGPDSQWKPIDLPFETRLKKFADRVIFSEEELAELGIGENDLSPFFMGEGAAASVADVLIGNSAVEFRPLLATNEGVLVIAPPNISTAVRALLIDTAIKGGLGKSLCYQLLQFQAKLMALSNFTEVAGPEQPIGDACFMRQGFYELSLGRYIHVVQIADGFLNWPDQAFGGISMMPEAVTRAVTEGILSAKQRMEALDGFKEGATLLLCGGWGAGHGLDFDQSGLEDWTIMSLEPVDAMILGACEDGSLRDFWRMNKELVKVEAQGFEFVAANGALNLFQWWRDTDFALVPPGETGITPPTTINFDTNRLLKTRKEGFDAIDRRAVMKPDGTYEIVMRLDIHAIERELEPIYAAADVALRGEMLAAILHDDHVVWLKLANRRETPGALNAFETWRAATRWIARVLPAFLAKVSGSMPRRPVLIEIEIQLAPEERSGRNLADEKIDGSVTVTINAEEKTGRIVVTPDWQAALYRPDNRAEVVLAAKMFWAIAQITGLTIDYPTIENLVVAAAGSPDIRWRHLFEATAPIDRLAALQLIGRFHPVPDSAGALVKCGTAWLTRSREEGTEIEGKDACVQFLSKHTQARLELLRKEIRRYNRSSLILAALNSFQSAQRDQRHWQSTARAMRAIMGVERDQQISLEHTGHANAVIRASTILVEIASADAPRAEGLTVGRMDLEELQALAMLYFHNVDTLAALYGDRIDPHFRISPTGDLLLDHEFEKLSLGQSTEKHRRKERGEASEEYIGRFEADEPIPPPSDTMLRAIEAEYKVDSQVVVDLPNACVILAEEQGAGVYVMKRSELVARLEALDFLKGKNVAALIDRLTLPARNGWDDIPAGCTPSDFDLGKFDRRYSLIARPIVALSADDDPELVVTPGTLHRTFRHNIGGAGTGMLQNEFWTSPVMRKFASDRGRETGLEFNNGVARHVKALGLDTYPSVKLSWCLNQKATDELKAFGDVDVLAISPNRNIVWVIEAKDLKLCRTRGEAASRLSGYRGKLTAKGKPDNMLRHLRRVEYIRQNSAALMNRLKLTDPPSRVCGVVMVHAPQPMEQFQTELPSDGRVMMLEDAASVPWDVGWP